ncbi:M56 family metallopeptidase [Flavivirga abyssicola]|uniref:M56 family metallopeptidase n=1 Tax=Flavivirga abyssicola TaxID=3063533 RepID=UPI0026DF3F32|nr:M56 family metallopeptidase [Flavivirga sp. MEBiC07777]WVK12286.1 M56 family metallopeptidase [Flavivirga sp. MEBiC07777]
MEYLLKVSAVVIIFHIIYKVFLQRDTFFESNRGFLLLGIITSFIIPFLVIPIYIEDTSALIADYNFASDVVVENEVSLFNVLDYIPMVYLIGLLFFSVRFIIQLASLFTLIFKNKSEKQNAFRFIKTNEDISPFSFFNWIVYNPNQFNKTELDQIITHEKIHVKQYHSIDILLTQLSCVVLWFNPFIWLYSKDIKQNLEFIADQKAQHKFKCKKSYQTTLLKTSVPSHQLALSNNFYNSLIKKRIVMLHKSKSKKINLIKYVLVIPLLAIFLMSFSTKKVYVEKAPTKSYYSLEIEIITKEYTNTDFDNLINKLKEKGITAKFNGIKRNSKGEITAIKISINSKSSNVNYSSNSNYSISSDEAIKPIKISFSDDGKNISIGNTNQSVHKFKGSNYTINHKDGKHKIYSSEKGHGVFVVSDDDVDENVEIITEKDEDIEHDEDIIVIKEKVSDEKKSYEVKTIKKNKDSDKIVIMSDDGTEPLYVINGKEVKKKEFEKLHSDDIKNVYVIKGEKAIKKYGEKGKHGVVEITTKKE